MTAVPLPGGGGTAVRNAVPGDAAAIAAIYAPHVLHGTASFEEVPPDAAEVGRRMAAVLDRGWPWLVAVQNGAVSGYAYAAQLNPRAGYRFTCEDSIYLHPDAIGQGLGHRLLAALIAAAAGCGFQRMIAVIGDADNAASVALHARHGFVPAGRLHRVGYKFGRWLDVVHMERTIGSPE